MQMNIIRTEKRLCTSCMEKHAVAEVLLQEHTTYKGNTIEYQVHSFYCDNTDELYVDEEQMSENDIALKDAYRKKMGLLTSQQIRAVRTQYDISQRDLCILLGWGEKTITRYEGHQVQDRAHDAILKKIGADPQWFLILLEESKTKLSANAYERYLEVSRRLYGKEEDIYLRKSIEARYIKYYDMLMYNGNVPLSLDKVVEVIRYFAASNFITLLYYVKLMKLLWYTDALSYKRRGQAITGLIYQALPMGIEPIALDLIIELRDIPCEKIDTDKGQDYFFRTETHAKHSSLSRDDIAILEDVITQLGKMDDKEIREILQRESAYQKTVPHGYISYSDIEELQIC